MDCNIFKKRLNDLLEDNLSYDLRKAMLEHMKDCEDCSALYKEELEIDELFKMGLCVEMQDFRSLRGDIMKNIDKNRYGANPVKKIIRHIKSHIATYTSLAAIITVFAFLIPYVRVHGLLGANKSLSLAPQNSTAQGTAEKAAGNNTLSIAQDNNTILPQSNGTDQNGAAKVSSYMPQFEKKQLDKNTVVKFNTPWELSVNKIYSATVVGKGTEAQEEGIATITVKNMSNGEQWSFDLINNEKQFTPKAVKWVDDENLLVIVGLGYGTVSKGGEIYMLNINSGLTAKADPQNTANLNSLSEITKINSVKTLDANTLSIDTAVLVYEDNQMNANHMENRTVTSPYSEIANSIR